MIGAPVGAIDTNTVATANPNGEGNRSTPMNNPPTQASASPVRLSSSARRSHGLISPGSVSVTG